MDHPQAPAGKGRKYARPEWERRWLLAAPPSAPAVRVTAIHDRYVLGTRLRLRRAVERDAAGERVIYRLTQKVPAPSGGPGLITTIYLTEPEHSVLAALPARELRKSRHSVPPWGIDVFEGELAGLVLAEQEFDAEDAMAASVAPPGALAEVTLDERFTGGRFVEMGARELGELLRAIRPPG